MEVDKIAGWIELHEKDKRLGRRPTAPSERKLIIEAICPPGLIYREARREGEDHILDCYE